MVSPFSGLDSRAGAVPLGKNCSAKFQRLVCYTEDPSLRLKSGSARDDANATCHQTKE